MEQIQQRIERALEQAESEIREVGAAAFRSGDDRIVGQAQEIVTALKALRANLNGSPSPTAPKRERQVRKEGRAKTRRSGKAAKDKFPKYTVRNGSLIRIGWSKKHKSEYEHKAPQAAFDATINAMAELAQTGSGPITAERIIERVNTLAGGTPSYQVYVVIGLLRKQGCVEQVGRDGYMIPSDLLQQGSQIWKQLVGM
jgi:hypothetical protein